MIAERYSLIITVLLSVYIVGIANCKQAEMKGPAAEVKETSINLDLPAVPEFVVPKSNPDGSHPVKEMLLKANKFIDTEVQVQGYVVWIYDCATAVRTAEMSDKEVSKLLAEHPEKCTRPHFILGEKPDTAPDRGLWVVEYPRKLRKDELKSFSDEMIKEEKTKLAALPTFAIGDQVTVGGQWMTRSPKGFTNTRGLLVYGSMKNNASPPE